ncbi:hypothetical protein, partial [Jeotgalibacillus marinus]
SKETLSSSTARLNSTSSSAAASSRSTEAMTAESFAVAVVVVFGGGVDGLRGPEHMAARVKDEFFVSGRVKALRPR